MLPAYELNCVPYGQSFSTEKWKRHESYPAVLIHIKVKTFSFFVKTNQREVIKNIMSMY